MSPKSHGSIDETGFLTKIDQYRSRSDFDGGAKHIAGRLVVELTYGSLDNVVILTTGSGISGKTYDGGEYEEAAVDGTLSVVTVGGQLFLKTVKLQKATIRELHTQR